MPGAKLAAVFFFSVYFVIIIFLQTLNDQSVYYLFFVITAVSYDIYNGGWGAAGI